MAWRDMKASAIAPGRCGVSEISLEMVGLIGCCGCNMAARPGTLHTATESAQPSYVIRQLKAGDQFEWNVRDSTGTYPVFGSAQAQPVVSPGGVKCLAVRIDGPGKEKTRVIARSAIYQDKRGAEYLCGVDTGHGRFVWGRPPDPSELMFPSPLRLGEHWTSTPTFADGLTRVLSARVTDVSMVRVPAGAFRVVVVHESFERRRGSRVVFHTSQDIWFAPSLGVAVRDDALHSGEHRIEVLTNYRISR